MKASFVIPKKEFSAFYEPYISLIHKNENELTSLESSFSLFYEYFSALSEEQSNFKYADNKWTLKEVLLHCIDTERIMSYRALRFARNDKQHLPGFDQDNYVLASEANSRSLNSLLSEYKAVKRATLQLFENLTENQLHIIGQASQCNFSVRALAYIIAGHELHHLNVCKTRYIFTDDKM